MKFDKNDNFEYDADVDSLTIYNQDRGIEKVRGSIVISNFIFDIGANGSFVSLEIDNASEVFSVDPSLFSKIEGARIKTLVQGNVVMFVYTIIMGNKEYERTLMIPEEKVALTI